MFILNVCEVVYFSFFLVSTQLLYVIFIVHGCLLVTWQAVTLLTASLQAGCGSGLQSISTSICPDWLYWNASPWISHSGEEETPVLGEADGGAVALWTQVQRAVHSRQTVCCYSCWTETPSHCMTVLGCMGSPCIYVRESVQVMRICAWIFENPCEWLVCIIQCSVFVWFSMLLYFLLYV